MTGIAATAAGTAAAQSGQVTSPRLPWEPKGTPAANVAMLYVETLLMNALKTERGVHAETLLTAVGALAGFSAQHAIWKSIVEPGKLPAHGGKDMAAGAFVVAEGKNGEAYYFGDLLNSYLLPQQTRYAPPATLTLFSFVAGAVASSGGKPLGNAELQEIFANASRTVGGPDFGKPRLPAGHTPGLMPREALNKLWPTAKQALQFRDPKLVAGGLADDHRHRGATADRQDEDRPRPAPRDAGRVRGRRPDVQGRSENRSAIGGRLLLDSFV
jgi:hypothetical protein